MERGIEHSGAWVTALFVIIIASWLLYKYLAPKTWREWMGAGLIHWPTLFSVGLFPIIAITYVLLARREEQKVIEEFGEEYLEYKRNVSAFLPVKGKWKQFIQRSGNSSDDPA